jgi:hypothetical protein
MTHKLGVGSVMIVLSTALFGVGCAKGVNFSGQSLNGSQGIGVVNAAVPACEVNVPQYYFIGQVNSFEFNGSGGGTFGYNQNGAASGAGGSASFQLSTASMSFTMDALNAMDLHSQIYGSTVTSDQTSVNLSGTVDFSQFNVDPNYYSSTPLATVALNGLNSAISAIKAKTDTQGWVGRIIQYESPTSAIINAGSVAGVEQGDTFNIYNDQFFWEDNTNPCASGNGYLGSQHVPTTPVAVATVTSVSTGTAFISLVLSGQTAPILGAEVIPLNLVAPAKGQPARYLEKNILLGSVAASSFTLPGGVGTYDFGSAVNTQFRNAVSSGGFIIMN